jgi:GxxExxY protein
MSDGDNKIIYPELSYRIVGILYSVFNELGYGYQEKYYQRALITAFGQASMKFKYVKLKYKEAIIGYYLADFLIEDKIILEIKVGDHFSQQYIAQTYAYLKATKLKLAILAHFTSKGIIFKRILNLY